jgi:hypothetical protein
MRRVKALYVVLRNGRTQGLLSPAAITLKFRPDFADDLYVG